MMNGAIHWSDTMEVLWSALENALTLSFTFFVFSIICLPHNFGTIVCPRSCHCEPWVQSRSRLLLYTTDT